MIMHRKECFANQNYFSAENSQGLNKYMARSNNVTKFIALEIDDKYKWYNRMWHFEFYKKDIWKPHSVGTVPLPEFTKNKITSQKAMEYKYNSKILNVLSFILFIFIPRWYKIGRNEKNKLSPFAR